MAKVGIVGTTSWGTTLGIMLARRGLDVALWARSEAEAARIRKDGQNVRFVPGVEFPPCMSVTSSADEALGDAELAIMAVPSSTLRDNVVRVRDALGASTVVVSATKGLEVGTGKRISQMLEEELTATATQSALATNRLSQTVTRRPLPRQEVPGRRFHR